MLQRSVLESYRDGMNTGREGDAMTRGLDELEAIRRRVINVVGHALRTPVTTMVGMATALQATDDDATRATLIEGLARNAGRVERLLDDLLLAAGVSTAFPVGDAASRSVRDTFEAEWRSLEEPNRITFSGPELSVLARRRRLRADHSRRSRQCVEVRRRADRRHHRGHAVGRTDRGRNGR